MPPDDDAAIGGLIALWRDKSANGGGGSLQRTRLDLWNSLLAGKIQGFPIDRAFATGQCRAQVADFTSNTTKFHFLQEQGISRAKTAIPKAE
jgi:hypothetical protein